MTGGNRLLRFVLMSNKGKKSGGREREPEDSGKELSRSVNSDLSGVAVSLQHLRIVRLIKVDP